MRPWRKSPPELVEAFGQAAPRDPRVERRTMFGYPALFVRGNMFAGTYGEDVVVRLPEAERTALVKRKAARPFEPMPGRPMKEYVVLPATVARRRAALASFLARGFAYAATLPPKKK